MIKPSTTPLLLETIVKLMPFSSKDETRPHLNGVHLFLIPNGIRLEATNGIIGRKEIIKFEDLGDFENTARLKEQFSDKKIIIPNSQLKQIKDFIKTTKPTKSKNIYYPFIELSQESMPEFLIFETMESVLKLKLIQRDYVNFARVIEVNNNNDNFIQMTFTPSELEKVIKSYISSGKSENKFKDEMTIFIPKAKGKKQNNQYAGPIFINASKDINSLNTSIIMSKSRS